MILKVIQGNFYNSCKTCTLHLPFSPSRERGGTKHLKQMLLTYQPTYIYNLLSGHTGIFCISIEIANHSSLTDALSELIETALSLRRLSVP